jgi:transposase
MSQSFTDISAEQLDALMERVAQAKAHQLTLSPEDCDLLLSALVTLAGMQEKLSDSDITIGKLRKLVGMVQSSETLTSAVTRKPARTGKQNKRKKPTVTPVRPDIQHHKLQQLSKGDICPECDTGKLYKTDPATFLRMTGQSPLKPTQHVMERLRCNTCGAYFTAEVSTDVTDDGECHQKYGYSARALMGISKYYAGSPLFRQGSMQDLLGVSVTASTVFDQIEYLCNALYPVFRYLKTLAADAHHYYLDDTTHRILDQKSIIKTGRDGKTRERTGVYASGIIATIMDDHHIVLFQTNIGHAGEFIDDILSHRAADLPSPILMSDALPCNQPSKATVHTSLCNSHARRQFYDVHSHFPDEVEWVIEEYGKIWQHDTTATEQVLSVQARCEYHQIHSLPVMKSIRQWGQTHLDNDTVEQNSGLGKAMTYLNKHFDGLTAFCRVPGAVLDNNKMENQLKLMIRDRKNAMFRKTQTGADIGDVVTSLIATCAEAGINVFDYFIHIQREHENVKSNPADYLPWDFKPPHPD